MDIARRPHSHPASGDAEGDAVLLAAERLFVDRGVDAVRLDEIVAAAGTTRAALRRRFAGKPALLDALRKRFVDGFVAAQREAMERCADGDWTGRLRAWTASGFHRYLDQVALHDVVFRHARSHDREGMTRNPAVAQLAALLEQGAAARAWVSGDAHMTAAIFFNALHATVDRLVAEGRRDDRQLPLQALTGYFERAVQWWRHA